MVPLRGLEPPVLLLTMQALCQLSYNGFEFCLLRFAAMCFRSKFMIGAVMTRRFAASQKIKRT